MIIDEITNVNQLRDRFEQNIHNNEIFVIQNETNILFDSRRFE